jgi:hypothetical protein
VVVHRRQLPIVGHCEGFVPAPGAADEGGFCERCRKQVYDVSAMRESELRRFLAARAGMRVCLSYRTDERGRLRLRPEPHPLALGALALLLVACAGHVSELEAPGMVCRDADGFEVACPTWVEPEMHSVPEVLASHEQDPEGCPVRPTAEGLGHAQPIGLEPLADASPDLPDAPVHGEPGYTSPAASKQALPTSAQVRTNFSIDPDNEFVRGMVVLSSDGWIERDFVPTAQLWKQWRHRRAEREAARRRWRESQHAVTSR